MSEPTHVIVDSFGMVAILQMACWTGVITFFLIKILEAVRGGRDDR